MQVNNDNNLCCKDIGYDLVLFSSLLAILLAKELSVDDQNLLSTLLQSIGENLAIIATVQGNCTQKNSG